MKILLIATTILIGGFPASHSAELPEAAQELANKLDKWEANEKHKFEDRVKAKRADVVEVLQNLLEKETKAGNLAGAVAVQKYIENLKPKNVESKSLDDLQVKGLKEKLLLKMAGIWDWASPDEVLTIKGDGTGNHTLHGDLKLLGVGDDYIEAGFPDSKFVSMRKKTLRFKLKSNNALLLITNSDENNAKEMKRIK